MYMIGLVVLMVCVFLQQLYVKGVFLKVRPVSLYKIPR